MKFRVAGLGEILWDRFPDGDRLGGAPANFAFHAGQLGAEAAIVSRIGADADGDRLAAELTQRGLSTAYLQRDSAHPTGLVTVTLSRGQPSYVIANPAAWDFLSPSVELDTLAGQMDAICFGSLAQRHAAARGTIRRFLDQTPRSALRLFDLNLRQDFYNREIIEESLIHATALKLNGDELMWLAPFLGLTTQRTEIVPQLFKRFSLAFIAITHGADGCELHNPNHAVHVSAPAITLADAVGAGDAFSAALVLGLLDQKPLEQIALHANAVGAYVASQPGAMPLLPEKLRQP